MLNRFLGLIVISAALAGCATKPVDNTPLNPTAVIERHVTNNGIPLTKAAHGAEIMQRSHDTVLKTRAATIDGAWNTDDVVGGISNEFWGHPRAGAMKFMANRDSMVRKNFTATNLGGSGAPYGLVPFDLLAPSRLIYPVYTLFRRLWRPSLVTG